MDYSTQRSKMIDSQIRTTDVTSHSILNAFESVAREEFVGEKSRLVAYVDINVEIGAGRYMMAASPLAKMMQLAEIDKDCTVLEIGTGTGYGSAILSHLAGQVVAVESDPALLEEANANLKDMDNVTVFGGPLEAGCPSMAPYDVILVNGAVDFIPEAIFAQLKEGGHLVAVLGEGASSGAHLFVRESGRQSERFAFNASVRKLPGFDRVAEFQF